MSPRYFLKDAHGSLYPITGPTSIGRHLTCQIMLDDAEASRRHALLWLERKMLYLRDENTKNGTFLNEWRIPPEKPIALSAGNQIRVGKAVYVVVSSLPSPTQPPAPAPERPNRLPLAIGLLLGAGLCLCLLLLAIGVILLGLGFGGKL